MKMGEEKSFSGFALNSPIIAARLFTLTADACVADY